MLGLFFFTPDLRLLAIFLMGTCLGFLRVNCPKASIFMGDVGSYYLGCLLFGLILMTVTHHPYLLFSCLSVTLLFTFDATYTLIKRVVTRQPFWKAHRSHWYQRLYNMGCSHKAIFWIGVAINSVLLSVTLLSFYFNQTVIGFMLSLMILVIIAFFIRYREYAVKL